MQATLTRENGSFKFQDPSFGKLRFFNSQERMHEMCTAEELHFYEYLWWSFLILLGYFHYDRLIGISRMSFLAAILNWNLRFRTSNFRSPH